MTIHSQWPVFQYGTRFTPEGVAKDSFWIPEDAFSWKALQTGSFDSAEVFEARRLKFEEESNSKTEIVEDFFRKNSLRKLLPDRWLLAYTRDKAWRENEGKKTPLYSQLKRTLLVKSFVLGYGNGPIHKLLPSKNYARYIKEHCASSARLKAMALRAYESVANMGGYNAWNRASGPIYLCLAAAKSSLDSMSAVLWALLFQQAPTGWDSPDMSKLNRKLKQSGHPFYPCFKKLYESVWCKKLIDVRNKIIHRSAGLVVHDNFGFAIDFDLGLFENMKPNSFSVKKANAAKTKKTKLIHLDKIMKGFVVGVEKWEKQAERYLRLNAWYTSLNTEGIIMGIEFNDESLLTDGSGPSNIIGSQK